MRTPLQLLAAGLIAFLAVPPAGSEPPSVRDLGREVLPANDGWAAAGAGTTGGSAATPEQVFVVTNRAGLVAALQNRSDVPKIVYVSGMIDVNVDDADAPLTCESYQRNGYTLEGYVAAHAGGDPAAIAAAEAARAASASAQQARVRIRPGSNTTIVGLGKKSGFRGIWLDIRDESNLIVRNLTFQDTFDCFPQFVPGDGFNAAYDSIGIRTTTNVWIDHNRLEDRVTADENQPTFLGELFQVHDGLLDITNAADLVTVSWNRFRHHHRVMLIGSSDSGSTAANDVGKLRVTLHHNLFDRVNQRSPRVRFGRVHVYNNYYKVEDQPEYDHSWGVGLQSAIYAENNFVKIDESAAPAEVIARFQPGTTIYAPGTLFETGTHVNGTAANHETSVLDAYNAENDPDIGSDVGWTPVFFTEIEATPDVPRSVQNDAGPFVWTFPES